MAEGERIYITRTKAILSREQKTGLGMVVGFGSLALVFGVFFLWKHIASPFVISYVGPQFLTGDEKQQQEMETLKKQDTDTDGLDDYNELYVYRTSPYLKDSDSDGTEDQAEITQGEDPNCAPSMPCATAAIDVVSPTTLQGTFAEQIAANAGATPPPEAAATSADIGATLAAMTTDQIRTMLIQAGGDAASINALPDDDLRAALSQAIMQMQVDDAVTDAAAASDSLPIEAGDTSTDSTQTTQ